VKVRNGQPTVQDGHLSPPVPGEFSNETAALAENRHSNVDLVGVPTGKNPDQEMVAPSQQQEPGRLSMDSPAISACTQDAERITRRDYWRELESPRSAIGGVIATIGHFTSDRRSFT
jgi:hypothetical protein